MNTSRGNYYYVKIPDNLISIISLWSVRGSSLDPKGKEGLTHFFEHLFLTRTATLPDKTAILRKIDGSGLFYNAYTRKNCVYYYFIQQSQDQEDSYKLLMDGIREFNINENDVNKERQIIISEQNQHITSPALHIWSLADKGLWPNNSLNDSGLGTKNSVYSIHLEDIMQFKNLLFSPQNLGFLTISQSTISSNLKNDLIKLTSNDKQPTTQPKISAESQKLVCEYRPMENVFLAISFPLPDLTEILPDKPALDFIRNYLASGWSSRLIERLRTEKNYTYWIYGGVEFFNEAGYFRISLSTNKKNIRDIIYIVIEEIQMLQQNTIDEAQLIQHKRAMKAHLIKRYIQPENMLWWFGWNIFMAHRMITLGDYFDLIENLKPAEIQTAARKCLATDKLHIAAIGTITENDFNI